MSPFLSAFLTLLSRGPIVQRVRDRVIVGGFVLTGLVNAPELQGQWSVDDTMHEVHVTLDGQTIATYTPESHGRPVVSTLYSPSGQSLTRRWPMLPLGPDEKSDHQHHRGLWFGHGEVNDIDFWADHHHSGADHRDGVIVETDKTVEVDEMSSVVIQTKNDWLSPTGERVCRDRRQFRFTRSDSNVFIDFTIEMIASDGPVHLGDSKEGMLGVRVAGSMKEDAQRGGIITTSDGLHGSDSWGKKAAWVDYSGPTPSSMIAADKETTPQEWPIAGVTIIDHPSNLNYPARWHVRTYGLFAVNPVGHFHFVGGDKTAGHTIDDGDTLSLTYRLVLHDGKTLASSADAMAKDFAETDVANFHTAE